MDYEREALRASFRDGYAVIVRKHKKRQEPIAPWSIGIDHFYIVIAGELEIFKKRRWWPAPAHTFTWLPRGVTYGIRQKSGYTGAVKVLIIQLSPPRGWAPAVGSIPTPVPDIWWRRLLDLEAEAEFNAVGWRVVPATSVLRFVDRLSAATAASSRAGSDGPKRSSTAGDWMAVWSRSQDVIAARASSGLTVEELAQTAHVSLVQLRRIFKAVAGCSPKAAIDAWRMTRAKQLLAAGKHTAAQIGGLVGFATPQQFSAAFRAACGMTPGQFAEES